MSLRSASLRLLHSQLHLALKHSSISSQAAIPARQRSATQTRNAPCRSDQDRPGQASARRPGLLVVAGRVHAVAACVRCMCGCVCALGPHVELRQHNLRKLNFDLPPLSFSLPSLWSPARLPARLNPVLSCPCPYRRGQPAKPGPNCCCCSATADHLDPELELSCLGLVHTKLVLFLSIQRSLPPTSSHPTSHSVHYGERAQSLDHAESRETTDPHTSTPFPPRRYDNEQNPVACGLCLPPRRTHTLRIDSFKSSSTSGSSSILALLPREAVSTEARLPPGLPQTPIRIQCHSDPSARLPSEPTWEPRLHPHWKPEKPAEPNCAGL